MILLGKLGTSGHGQWGDPTLDYAPPKKGWALFVLSGGRKYYIHPSSPHGCTGAEQVPCYNLGMLPWARQPT